jgi:LPS-assembly lipoprotein
MIKFFLTTSVILFTLTSCGFHLRGKYDIAPEYSTLNLEAPESIEHSIFITELKAKFAKNKIHIADHDSKAPTLYLLDERLQKEVLSTSSTSYINQYKLTYTIKYKLITEQQVVIMRSYYADPNNMLDNDNEQNLLTQEMRRDAISEILRRIEHAGKK